MKVLFFLLGVFLATVAAQMMPQPMPMPMPMQMGGPMGGGGMGYPGGDQMMGGGFNPMMGGGFNPYMPPQQIPARNMDLNQRPQQQQHQNDKNNAVNGTDTGNKGKGKGKPTESARSGTEQMLDNMGLHGIQDFYTALTSELARNPNGYQAATNDGQPGGTFRRK